MEYALTSNGARIIRIPSGETVYEELIPWEVALQVIEVMKQWAGESCNWETYFAGNIYVEEETYHFVKPESMSPAMERYILKYPDHCRKYLTEKHPGGKDREEKLHLNLCRYKRTGLQREGTATDVSESEYLPCDTV